MLERIECCKMVVVRIVRSLNLLRVAKFCCWNRKVLGRIGCCKVVVVRIVRSLKCVESCKVFVVRIVRCWKELSAVRWLL